MDGIDFASKGLSNVALDSYSGKVPTDPTLSGRATLDLLKEGSPFLDRWAIKSLEFPRKVRFKAVSNRNREGASRRAEPREAELGVLLTDSRSSPFALQPSACSSATRRCSH
jgi:hypothetical protein